MVDEFAPDPMMTDPKDEDHPSVSIHPPTVLFAALVLGYVIRLFAGGRLPLPRAFAEGVGGALILVSLGIVISAVSRFAEEGETLKPDAPSRSLLREGPYRFSRNPIYLAMMLFGAGFGIATSNIWIILATLSAGVMFHFLVIKPEENYLSRRFGEEYDEYRRNVRRWI